MQIVLLLLLANAAYVAAWPAPNLFYVANVLLHLLLGSIAFLLLGWQWRRSARIAPLCVAAALGVFLSAEPSPRIAGRFGRTSRWA